MREREKESVLYNHCIVLFSYVSKHRGEWQSYEKLSNKTGIPISSLYYIVNWQRIDNNNYFNDLKTTVGEIYGYDFYIYPTEIEGKIIDVVKSGSIEKRILSKERNNYVIKLENGEFKQITHSFNN